MKKLLIILAIFISFFTNAQAADFSVSSPKEAKTGEVFEVLISANSDGEAVNSFEASIAYDVDLLNFKGYKNTDTLLKIFILSPKEVNGVVRFSGIIPGGVSGLYDANSSALLDLPLVSLVFEAKKNGVGTFSLSDTKMLKNDGMGTALVHAIKNSELFIEGNDAKVENEKNKPESSTDKKPPEPFEVSYIISSFFSKTPSLIMFNTNDEDTGIKSYMVKESWKPWTEASSPYKVNKGIFAKAVTVRAYDYAGNYRDSTIVIPSLIEPKHIPVIVLAVFLLGLLLYKLLKYRV